MDRQDGSIGIILRVRMVIFVLWVFMTTVLYALPCVLFSAFYRWAAREMGRAWSSQLLAVGGIKVEIKNAEKLSKKERYVFVSNHQSALDIPVLMCALKNQLSFIAKKELFYIPFFGWGIWAMGHVWIDRSNARKARASIDRAIKRLEKEKISLLIFPEGTRSPDGNLQDFKQASFTLAIEAKTKVVPVTIVDAYKRLPKKSSRIYPGTIHVVIGDPIDTTGLKTTDKGELSKRVHEVIRGNIENAKS